MNKYIAALFCCLIAIPAHAEMTKRMEADLRSLDPQTRLEQLCDVRAMEIVGGQKEGKHHDPDRTVADATNPPVIKGDTVIAEGAALRSHGKWHALKYTCTATPDHMKVIKFDYELGPYIPQTEWDKDGLFD